MKHHILINLNFIMIKTFKKFKIKTNQEYPDPEHQKKYKEVHMT